MEIGLLNVAIPAGAPGISAALDLSASRLAVIYVPASWVAANITVQASYDGTNFFNMYDRDGLEYTILAAASRAVQVPLVDFLGVKYAKLRSGTAAAPVNQTGAPTLVLALVP